MKKDYIELDKIQFHDGWLQEGDSHTHIVFAYANDIMNLPIDEFEPAVRCRECNVPHNKWTGCPKLNGLVTTPDFFCAFGERK